MRTSLSKAEKEITSFIKENVIVDETISVSSLDSRYLEKYHKELISDKNLLNRIKNWQFNDESIVLSGKKVDVKKGNMNLPFFAHLFIDVDCK